MPASSPSATSTTPSSPAACTGTRGPTSGRSPCSGQRAAPRSTSSAWPPWSESSRASACRLRLRSNLARVLAVESAQRLERRGERLLRLQNVLEEVAVLLDSAEYL